VKVFLNAVPNGRLMRYDLQTNEVTVLLDDLRFGNGLALAQDDSYLLIQETSLRRIR
jgi:sugar lactone lactonase YvrE